MGTRRGRPMVEERNDNGFMLFEEYEVEEFLAFLDGVRLSGRYNMVTDAARIEKRLVDQFGVSNEKAALILSAWRDTFDSKATAEERARRLM